MRLLVVLMLALSALTVAAPEAAACHPPLSLDAGLVGVYVDVHGCGGWKPDPTVCVWTLAAQACPV